MAGKKVIKLMLKKGYHGYVTKIMVKTIKKHWTIQSQSI